jgi:hypothetical protein
VHTRRGCARCGRHSHTRARALLCPPPQGDGKPSKKAKVEGSKDDIFGGEQEKQRNRTEEGYAIYTEDELKMGDKGGDTDLCPFDCDCCY